MASKTEICNLAISHIGIAKDIGNVETDATQEATACRRFFEVVKKIVLREWSWPFARKQVLLGLITETPNNEWAFSYAYPADALKVIRILSGIRNDTHATRVRMFIYRGAAGREIFTDQRDACLEYVVNEADIGRFPEDFVNMLALRLAAYIAPRLTRGDPNRLGVRALALYNEERQEAMANSANEEEPDVENESALIDERE